MRYTEGIDYDTWWNGLDLHTRRELEAQRRKEALTRRQSEVRDYSVQVIWTEVAPSQGPAGADGPVTYAMLHPREGSGFQCHAEAIVFAIEIEREQIANGLKDVQVKISRRIRWKTDGEKMRLGTTTGWDDEFDVEETDSRWLHDLHAAWARRHG